MIRLLKVTFWTIIFSATFGAAAPLAVSAAPLLLGR